MLPFNIANRVLAKLVQSRSENRQCLQRMGGRPIVWQRLTTAKTATGETSHRTNSRRETATGEWEVFIA